MKALNEIRTIEEKNSFMRNLENIPCTSGRIALLNFHGSVEEYFLNHKRGAKALVWCLYNGLDAKLLTNELCISAVKQDGHCVKYLTTEQRSPEVCLAAVHESKKAVDYLTNEQRKYVEGI